MEHYLLVFNENTNSGNMKIKNILGVIIVCVLAFGCSSTKKVIDTNPELDSMIEQESFAFAVKFVEPQVTAALASIGNSGLLAPGNTISRIDVTGSGYFLKLNGELVSADMPYYGERQMGGGYNSDTGIKFNGTTKNLKIVKDEDKKSYKITFNVAKSAENYFFTIDVTAALNTTVWVQSSHRNRIRYLGKISEFTSEEPQ